MELRGEVKNRAAASFVDLLTFAQVLIVGQVAILLLKPEVDDHPYQSQVKQSGHGTPQDYQVTCAIKFQLSWSVESES